jgi:hypothetical protein
MIKEIITKYNESIKYYLNISNGDLKNEVKCCVFEKSKPTNKEGVLKDGFHLIFPDTCVQTKLRHLIRNRVVESCISDNIFSDFTNSPEKIIDKAVVSTNGWFLYGSKKSSGYLYELTKIYDIKLNLIYNHNKAKKMQLDNVAQNIHSTHEYYTTNKLSLFSVTAE